METSLQRESRVAKEIGARPQPRSGATPWHKEDMRDEVFLYQHKQLEEGTKGHRVEVKALEELRHHAIDDDLHPVYIIEYGEHRWYMVEEIIFEQVKELFDESGEHS